MQVKSFRTSSDLRKQKVAELLRSPRDLLIMMIMFNTMVNILIQNVTSSLFGDFSGWSLNVGVPLALTLIFGEVLPKSFGMANNTTFSYRVAPFLCRAKHFFQPVSKILIAPTQVISQLMFFFLKKEEEISLDELNHTLKTSREYGILHEDEAELVQGYLNLQGSQVKELMRPREEMLFFDLKEPLSKLVHLFVDQKCSRLPVCEDNLDNVVGMINAKLYFLNLDKLKESKDLKEILKKPFFVPEAMSAEGLLRQMYERKESLALVVDEYGSISGLVALEDLVERVVGEIKDARDAPSRYTKAGDDVIIASGKMEVVEFEELFATKLVSPNHMVTVGGWLIEKLGDIPKSGEKCTFDGFLFHVLAADSKRIRRLYIRRLNPVTGWKKKEKE